MSTSRLASTLAAASALGVMALASPALASTTSPTPSTSPAATTDATTPTNPTTDTTPASTPVQTAASAHIRYSVSGRTVTLTPYVTGTQHEMNIGGKTVRSALPVSYAVTVPAGATQVSGSAAGDSGMAMCTNEGSVALSTRSLSGTPLVYRFSAPGTYKVTLNANVCTSGAGATISKTVYVTVPAASTGAVKTKVPNATTPATQPAAPVKAATGPKVNTDYTSVDDSTTWGLAALGGASLIGAGALFARRRTN